MNTTITGRKVFCHASVHEYQCGNGNTIYYRDFDGLFLPVALYEVEKNETEIYGHVSCKLANILKDCIRSKNRIRVWYGDVDTGRAWNEEYDVTGYVGKTCGNIKVPILVLVHNSRSYGGGELMVSSLLRIDDIATHKTLWTNEYFHADDFFIIPTKKEGLYDVSNKIGEMFRMNVSFKEAERYVGFMTGKRYSK